MSAVPTNPDAFPTWLLLSSWLLSITWGIVVAQTTTYFRNRKKDHPLLQGVVFFLFLNETVVSVLHYVAAHHQTIVVRPGTVETLNMHATATIAGFFSHITLCLVNLFLIRRYYLFTKRKWITIPLAFASLASTCANFYDDVLGVRISHYATNLDYGKALAEIDRVMIASKVSTSLNFAVVTAVYLVMLMQLMSWLREDLIGAKKMVKRLAFITAECGTVTVALAAVKLANTMRKPDGALLILSVGFAARTYYMTMLFNLNMREHSSMAMPDPSLSHLTSQLRTQPGQSSGEATSADTGCKETTLHVQQDVLIEMSPEKTPRAYLDRDGTAV